MTHTVAILFITIDFRLGLLTLIMPRAESKKAAVKAFAKAATQPD